MNTVRAPAVAGTFYTDHAGNLAASVDAMLAQANGTGPVPKAIIAPHAGHVYSGPVAAHVYARLIPAREKIRRVVLLGPSHRVAFRGIAAPTASAFRTPLGDIPVDTGAIASIAGLPNTGYLDEAHGQEHSLEVHLPFLQRVLDDFTLVPLVVGDASADDVARVLDALWDGDETLIVISSDLSHYHSYEEARRIDSATAARILALDDNLDGNEACGCRPVNGLLRLARQRHLEVEQVDLRNSGDTAGGRDQVVGYGAWIIVDNKNSHRKDDDSSATLPLSSRQRLLQVAREAILKPLTGDEKYNIDLSRFDATLVSQRASFVTINSHGRLRGCIGSLVAHRALVVDVAHNAQAAAFQDPRFSPLTLDEYSSIDVHISVLGEPTPLAVDSRQALVRELRPGIDGLIIEEHGRRATYLPSVWEQLPDPEDFVRELRRKGGMSAEGWSDATRVMRYTTEEFS